MWTKFVCLLLCVELALAQVETKTVLIDQGPVRGYKSEQDGVFAFLEIPYATAPTGTNKFKAPLPPPVWTDTFDAVAKWIMCPQATRDVNITSLLPMQEDCLVANVHVPDTNATNLPVMVVVHGGAYLSGIGLLTQFNSLVRTEKVIVVSFNYRLGVHGFLCLGTEDVPGNAALKDVVALLRWVNRNIASFGGNPDDVTVSGCSAGGGMVEYLTLSPMTAGLFKKVITDSGSVFGITGPQGNPIENAKIYAKQLNFTDVDDLKALEEFYKNASHDVLLSKVDFIIEETDGASLLMAPCVERQTGDEIFLHDAPVNIIKNGNYTTLPLLYAFAEMEGLIRIQEFDFIKDRMNENFADFLPDDLQFENDTQKNEFAGKVKQFYFGDQGVTEETILSYVDYFTDVLFAYPMLRTTNLRRESLADTIYLYEYLYADETHPLVPHTNVRGSDHCYQFLAVADEDVTNATEEYKNMKEFMREIWLSFILTGNPRAENSSLPSWPSVDGYVSPYMSINATSRVVQSPLLEDRVRFWDSIYETNYKLPVPPSETLQTPSTEPTTEMSPDNPTGAPTENPTTAAPGSAVTSTASFILLATVIVLSQISITIT